ncbi:hypothetical protein Calab_1443 [Caldithrix abyssi DSM 13497]|uniref:Uncharacterized protein n=1 Tax=Caldithrix abyssi DSM 13497 TaxID=880073 RepID=H1XPT8_CALAY|nr:hypothetical protein [Caldithrix abyssi]APF20409.1 hypothetical protein Cabys_3663 [Caldithrix abyssi DSM 13497]EHO41064.1 hypothetical protein Calab_1443 [Caldithrix abyssi DSM 13497]
MKAILQYSTDGTNYINVGELRSDEKDYKLKPVTEMNEDGNPEILGYQVECRTILLEKDDTFLNQTSCYFRLHFDDGKVINLGTHSFSVNHDLMLNKTGIEEIEIVLNFFIEKSDYQNYVTPMEV